MQDRSPHIWFMYGVKRIPCNMHEIAAWTMWTTKHRTNEWMNEVKLKTNTLYGVLPLRMCCASKNLCSTAMVGSEPHNLNAEFAVMLYPT